MNLGRLTAKIDELEAAGRTVVAVSAAGEPLRLIALGDEIRAEAVEALAQIRAVGLAPIWSPATTSAPPDTWPTSSASRMSGPSAAGGQG